MDGRWQTTLFAVLGLGAVAGCGPEQIDYVHDGPGCSTCEACGHQFGSCKGAGVACKTGYADLDADTKGCETPVGDAENDWTAKSSSSESIAWFVINEKGFDMFAWPELVAVDGELDCVASIDDPCTYTIRALKLALTDFEFDGVRWLDGSVTLTGPWDVADRGEGLVLERAPLIFGFDFEQGDEKTSAVSSGNAEIVVQLDAALSGGSLSIALLDTVSFGGCTLDAMSVSARLNAF